MQVPFIKVLNVTQLGINHRTSQYEDSHSNIRGPLSKQYKWIGKHRGLQSEPRLGNISSPQLTRHERLWWLEPTVIFWWYAIFILHRTEGHNLHYADKSIIHEQNSSQNSKTQLFDLQITIVHSVLLSSRSPLCSSSPSLSGPSAEELQPQQCPGGSWTLMPPSSGKYRHTGDVD